MYLHFFSHSLSPYLLFNLSLFSSSILSHSFLPPPPPPPSCFTLSFHLPFSFSSLFCFLSFPPHHPHPSPHLSTSKDLVPSTRVKKRSGREVTAVNDSVLDKNQPYLTTNNRYIATDKPLYKDTSQRKPL